MRPPARARGLPPAPADAEVRDLRGGFVLPGLIGAHVHVTAITADLGSLGATSPFYTGAHAARIMSGILSAAEAVASSWPGTRT